MAHTATLLVLLLASSFSLFNPRFATAISACNGPCNDLNDCSGQLICINGRCNDDPDVGTHICSSGSSPSPPSGGGSCASNGHNSPPVTSSTPAKFTLNDFSEGGDGGGPSECDGNYHPNSESVVALSTGWYNKGSRCGKMIRITAGNGRTTTAKVVDECDSVHGCDQEHAGQGTCDTNVVDGSVAVWNALGLNTDVGVEHVTWSMA